MIIISFAINVKTIIKSQFIVKLTDMSKSIKVIVFGDSVLGKIFTGIERVEIVQFPKENDINKLKYNISKQFYQHFRVKMKILLPSNKITLIIDSVDQIDRKERIAKLRKIIQQNLTSS
jgi:hypothetical protein